MDCLFCKIIEGEIPSYLVYEDELVKVVLDAFPDVVGHMLILVKQHTQDLDSIDQNTLLHVMMVAKKMKVLLEKNLHADGVTLIQNNGIAQEIKHFHLHLKPTYSQPQEMKELSDVLKQLKTN